MALRGDVRLIHSDPRTQLVGATRELKEWRQGWKQEELTAFGSERQLEWIFIGSNSQHQNGIIKCIIKMIKGAKKGNVPGSGGHEINTK